MTTFKPLSAQLSAKASRPTAGSSSGRRTQVSSRSNAYDVDEETDGAEEEVEEGEEEVQEVTRRTSLFLVFVPIIDRVAE